MSKEHHATQKYVSPSGSSPLPADEKKPVILFIDDEQSILVAIKRLTRKMPWQVITAGSGQEALEVIAENTIDVVVSDMRMPEMNGAAVLAAINEHSPNTKQILMTGYSDIESTVSAINNANIYSYITKPWDNENLKSTITRALYEQSLEQERNTLSGALEEKNAELESLNTQLEDRVATRTSQLEKAIKAINQSAKRTKDSQIEIVKLLSNMIEQRGVTAKPGRAARVAKSSCHLAKKLDFDKEQVEHLYFAALLSDIGKMALPDSILNEPFEKLTPQNQALYKQHPILAEATLMSISAFKQTSEYLRHQCEKHAGGGYPDNLIGSQIPTGAQLIGIASHFDELLYGTSSTKGLDPDEAIRKLKACADNRFSSTLVELFVSQLEAGPIG